MYGKRGLSDVVTTLLIILLSVVAIGVVWVIIQSLVSEGEDISLVGLNLDLEIQRTSSDDTNLDVDVKRNPGEGDLVGINFIVSDGSNSDVLRKNTNLAQLGSEKFTFVLSVLDVDEIKEISIAPVYLSPSGKEVIGEILDTVTFSSGEVGSGGGVGAGSGDGNDNGIPDDEEGDSGDGGTGDGGTGDGGEECVPVCNGVCGNGGCPELGDDYCGTCDEGFTCGENQQCYDVSCEDEDPSVTCEGFQCGQVENNCGKYIDCNSVTGGCSPGENCEENICVAVTELESGTIENVWPPGIGIYFDSDDLNKTDSLYIHGELVAFPTVDVTKCYTIVGYDYDPSVYPNAIAELFLSEPLDISTGDSYSIWDDNDACLASLV